MFDPNAYRKEVLKPLLDRGEHDVSDPFAVLGLDPSVDDDDLIRERVDDVVAFWRKEQSSPRYKGLVSSLLAQQDRISALLLDPTRRAETRDRVQGASEEADAEAAARVDELLDALERRHGGIPRDRIDRLRAIAAREGITDAQVDARLADRTLLAVEDDDVEPVSPAVRRQVANLLAELARLDPDHGTHTTLYGFLGLPIGAGAAEVGARREAIDARNRQRRHDRLRTVVDELVALSDTLLVSGDPRRYLAGIEADVRDHIRPAVETAVLLDDKVGAAEAERLTREAVSAGIDPDAARDLVIEVARSLNAPIDVGTPAEYVVCAVCNATNTDTAPDAVCTTCGAELRRDCPKCGRRTPRSAVACVACRFDLRAFDEAAEDLAGAAADLDAGRLGAAAERVEAAAGWSEDLPEVVELRRRVAEVERTAADAWAALVEALAAGRVGDARPALDRVAEIAHDRPGPDGRSVAEVTTVVETAERDLAVGIEEASRADDPEAALVGLLDRHGPAPALTEALAGHPVAPAGAVTATPTVDGVVVGWAASPAAGLDGHVVRRTVDRTGGATVEVTTTGAAATEALDRSPPAGEPVTYAVVAVRAGIEAEASRSAAVVAAPDVEGLEVVGHDGAVELRWLPHRVGEVWVDRDQPDDPDAMTRRLRGGPTGVLDSAVRSGTHYRYRVQVAYQPPGSRDLVRSPGVEISTTAWALPPAPPAPRVVPDGRSIRVTVEPPDPPAEPIVLRADTAPSLAPGTVVAEADLRGIGGRMAGRDGTAFGTADGRPRWYVPVYLVEGSAVIGQAVLHPGVGEVTGVRIATDDRGVVVTWDWPEGCTEAVVHWARDRRTVEPDAPGNAVSRTTNTAYEIDGGWRPGIPTGPISVLVLAAARVDGTRVTVPTWTDTSRATT